HPTDHLVLYLETDRRHGPPVIDLDAGRRGHFYLEPAESHQQSEHHHHLGRSHLGVVLLLFFRRTHGAWQGRGPDRHSFLDDRIRRSLRLYRDGPHVPLDRATDRSH